ncbi:MAG: alpha/beta hydrolase domain-containing protein [Candidatus Electrothrix communis]|nr:MAG: alpha/beta hydrolase domain-containing protein [Candidatus Electrothrix communis]
MKKNTISNVSRYVQFVLFSALALLLTDAQARITRIDVQSVQPGAPGFEIINGIAYGEVDPSDKRNALITDIEFAPKTDDGQVEYSTEFRIQKPVGNGSAVMLYDAVNRGAPVSELILGPAIFGVPSVPEERGYISVWSGWQGDLKQDSALLNINVPVATDNGQTITGNVRTEYIVKTPASTLDLSSGEFSADKHLSYIPVNLDTTQATLTIRAKESDPGIAIAPADWAYADCSVIPFPGVADASKICLKDGFDSDYIYELIYEAKDPLVLGLGLAATRDFVSFLRHAEKDTYGNPNPIAGQATAAMMHGTSQSGRFVRSFIDLGFNEDEQGMMVFEGANPHIAPGRIPINVRFGQPGRGYGQHEDHLFPAHESPFTWAPLYDSVAGQTVGLLDRCNATDTCPKIMWTVSSTEYWQGRASLHTTDAEGKHDVGLPGNVRMYLFSGTQHVAFPGLSASKPAQCQQLSNPNSYIPHLRALIVALEEWIVDNRQPPKNNIPTIREKTLTASAQNAIGFPNIPGMTYTGLLNELTLIDYGPDYDALNESGILQEPPFLVTGADYTVLVPKVDSDGNEVAGIKSPDLLAPLGTYTGWNLRDIGYAEGELCGLTGSHVPFAETEAERLSNGDSRPSLEARYGDHQGYVDAVQAAVDQLVADRLLLPSDAARYMQWAERSSVLQ